MQKLFRVLLIEWTEPKIGGGGANRNSWLSN
jgi:hypothetical protein